MRRMRYLIFYLFGFTAFVAACQPVTPKTVNTAAAPNIAAAPDHQTEIDVAISAIKKHTESAAGTDFGKGTVSDTNRSAEEAVIAAIPEAPPVQPTPAKPQFRPKTVIGSVSIMLIRDLGIASMIRQEGPIEIWQYRFAECVVDFFFYPASQGSSQLIIKDWDMRSAVIGGRVSEGKCLAAMDRHHQKLVARS